MRYVKRAGFIAAAMCLMFFAACGGGGSSNNNSNNNGNNNTPARVTVPNVVGTTETAARSAITSAGLTVGTVTFEHHASVPSGSVIRQNPSAGTSVAKGSAINLVVSSGPSFTDAYAGEMMIVAGGTFLMGCADENESACPGNQIPAHDVALGDFYIGKYVVTQARWKAVMGADNNPSMTVGDNLPVTDVSWAEVQDFIAKLNTLTGKTYRLPTEAEWEYAARGGNQSHGYRYSGSNNISEAAWYEGNSSDTVHAVGTKAANELGLYDMSGNVWEWVSDWYGIYGDDPQTNPRGPASGAERVGRGGSWYFAAEGAQVSFRKSSAPDVGYFDAGFRLALNSK